LHDSEWYWEKDTYGANVNKNICYQRINLAFKKMYRLEKPPLSNKMHNFFTKVIHFPKYQKLESVPCCAIRGYGKNDSNNIVYAC
jgi:hypothetical protein